MVLLQKAIYIYTIIVPDFNPTIIIIIIIIIIITIIIIVIIIIVIMIIIIMVTFKHICSVLLKLFDYCRN